jgi:hypothetical protein
MFKPDSSAQEIARQMAENLMRRANEKKFAAVDNLNKAVDHLQAAAEIFDDAGLYAEAEAITSFLEKMADKKKL